MFKYVIGGAALALGGAFLGYSYAMDSVQNHLKKQGEYNKEIIDGLQNVVDELKKPVPVVEKIRARKRAYWISSTRIE